MNNRVYKNGINIHKYIFLPVIKMVFYLNSELFGDRVSMWGFTVWMVFLQTMTNILAKMVRLHTPENDFSSYSTPQGYGSGVNAGVPHGQTQPRL